MMMEAVCILNDEETGETIWDGSEEETVWVDLDRIHSSEDLYEQVEKYFGDRLFGIDNEPDILAAAGILPAWED